MAKKTAPKKKAATVKSTKSINNTLKSLKAVKTKSKAKPSTKNIKQAVGAKKGDKISKLTVKSTTNANSSKNPVQAKKAVVTDLETETKKRVSVVSIMEAESQAGDIQRVEKISKVKPVKVDRGNLADEKAKWIELNKKYGKDKALAYKMTDMYPSLVPLQHKVLGWGFILTNDNDRLEVLFENGIRMLISNYKPV